jgi:hypothetical protein
MIFGFTLFLLFAISLFLSIANQLHLFRIDFVITITSNLLELDSFLHNFDDLLLEDGFDCFFYIFRKRVDVFVHLLDPSSFVFVADLQVDGEILFKDLLELVLQVGVVVGEFLVLVFEILPSFSDFDQFTQIFFVFLFQSLDSLGEINVFSIKAFEFFLIARSHEQELFLKELLALLCSFGEVKNDLTTDTPSKFPYLLSHSALFTAAFPNDPDEFLHSHPHDHVLILNALFGVDWRILELIIEPFLELSYCGSMVQLMLYFLGCVIAGA